MFSFLARLRLTSTSEQARDDADDTSSLNRSLSLPWPVTESSARRPTATSTIRKDMPIPSAGHTPAHGTTSLSSGLVISNPIPRSQASSLTGFTEYHTASSASLRSASPAIASSSYGRPPRQVQPQGMPWYEHEKARKLNQWTAGQASSGSSQYAPPQVVRLDSEALIPEPKNEDGEDSPPPKYVARTDVTEARYLSRGTPSTSTIRASLQAPHAAHSTYTKQDDTEDDSEFYTSPFDSDPEDLTPTQARFSNSNTSSITSLSQFPKPPSTSMPKSKWNLKLQLHAVKAAPDISTGTDDLHLRDTNPHLPQDLTPGSLSHERIDVDTDVYRNAYNHPLVQQLSPIPEQDYFSPTVESPGVKLGRSNGSLQKPSPGSDSLVSLIIGSVKGTHEKEPSKTRPGPGRSGSGGSVATVNGSDITRPSPIYSSPFLTRQLNRTVSQSSSRSDSQSQHPPTPGHTQPPTPITAQTPVQSLPPGIRPSLGMSHVSTALPRTNTSTIPSSLKEVVTTPTSAGTTATNGTIYHTPTSPQQTPTIASPITPSILAGANLGTPTNAATPAITLTGPSDSSIQTLGAQPRGFPKIPSLPNIPPMDWRSSVFGSVAPRGSREIRDRLSVVESARKGITGDVHRMPSIDASGEGNRDGEDDYDYEDEELDEDDDDYDHESLHAESFVTAGTNDAIELDEKISAARADGHDLEDQGGVGHSVAIQPGAQTELSVDPSAARESFIDRRWERDAAITSSPTTAQRNSTRWPVRFSKPKSHASPALWTFWLGFIFPVLWLIGGWHFTNIGELPPRFSVVEWYFWNSTWGFSACLQGISNRVFGCCLRTKTPGTGQKLKKTHKKQNSDDTTASTPQTPRQRRKGKRSSGSRAPIRAGQVYPSLPRWVADKQSSDDGRMRLNDPKRSLRGISFGYPFIARPMASQDSAVPTAPSCSTSTRDTLLRIICAPNRVLDLLYGIKLQEVRGRPESGRRMFDPWIQRCRYALCYALIIVAAGLCTASVYLIAINTRKIER